jgi:hypothetical protein
MHQEDAHPPASTGPDQLSPNRALRESTGSTGSQRLGNSGPVANPTVSFPEEHPEDETGDRQGVG